MAQSLNCKAHAHKFFTIPQRQTACCRHARSRAVRADIRRRHVRRVYAAATEDSGLGGFGAALKKLAKQVQGVLPIVGLLSRLTATGGGVGSDEMSYPDFCRLSYEVAPEEFNLAFADWSDNHGKEGQRRYILLCLWMAVTGAGLVPPRSIILSMRRQDIEVEMDRFEGTRDVTIQKYTNIDRPKGSMQERVDIAVDALCTLCIGIKDDVVPNEDDQELLIIMASAAVSEELGLLAAKQLVKQSIAARPQRAINYAAIQY